MARSVNKVMLIGNIGRDPEERRTSIGSRIVTFSLAVSEQWKDRTTGQLREKTDWVRVVVYNEALGNIAMQILRKGSRVYVEGKLHVNEWTDDQGNKRITTEVALPKVGSAEIVLLSAARTDGLGEHHDIRSQQEDKLSHSDNTSASSPSISQSASEPHVFHQKTQEEQNPEPLDLTDIPF